MALDVGKRMAMSGVNWATRGIGSGASTGIASTAAKAAAKKYITNVAESAVEAAFTDQDWTGNYWETASISENWTSYASAGIGAGLGEGAGAGFDLAVTGETKLNAFGMVEMNIGGSDGFSSNWGTDGHNAGAVVGSTIGYLDSLGRVMSGWHTAEDNTQNANRLTLLSTDGEIGGKNLTEKEIAEMLEAQEEARRIAEEKEREEKLSDYDFDGTIGKNPQEYDYNGDIGREEIKLAADTHVEKPYVGALKELIGEQDIHLQIGGDGEARGLYFDFNNEGRGLDLKFGTGQVELPGMEFNIFDTNIKTYGTIETLTGSSGTHFDNSGVYGEAGGYMIKYAPRVDWNTKNNSFTGGLNLYLGGAGWGLKLGSTSVIKLPGFGVETFFWSNKKGVNYEKIKK